MAGLEPGTVTPDQDPGIQAQTAAETDRLGLTKSLFSAFSLYDNFSSGDAYIYRGELSEISWRTQYNNIMEHGATVFNVADILCGLLKITGEERIAIRRAAAFHDLAKREEVKIRNSVAKHRAWEYLHNNAPSPNLTIKDVEDIQYSALRFLQIKGLSPEIIDLINAVIPEDERGPQTLAKKIIWLADAMTSGSDIVPIADRMEKAQYKEVGEHNDASWAEEFAGREDTIEFAVAAYDHARRTVAYLTHAELYNHRYKGRSLHDVQLSIARDLPGKILENMKRLGTVPEAAAGAAASQDDLSAIVGQLYRERLQKFEFEAELNRFLLQVCNPIGKTGKQMETGFNSFTELCRFLYIRLCPPRIAQLYPGDPSAPHWEFEKALEKEHLDQAQEAARYVEAITGFFKEKSA